MEDDIKLKLHKEKHLQKKKPLHKDIEDHHRKIEKITRAFQGILDKSEDDRKEYLKAFQRPPTKKEVPKETIGTEPMLKLSNTNYMKKDGESMEIKRVNTGIEGLDELIEGGIPEKSLVLLTGTTGAGKSTFAMNFLVEGAKNGENGIYVSLEENIEQTINEMRLFGWPVDKLIEEGKIMVIQPELYNYDALLTAIEEAIDKVNAKRLVIDSISIIGMYFEEPFKIRKSLLDLGYLLKKLGCTTLAITEIGEGKNDLSNFGIEEFISDGVFVMYYFKKGNNFLRAITVRKMRSTKHSTKVHPIEIKRPGGIVVYSNEEVFSDM